MAAEDENRYVIPTLEVDPSTLDKLDTRNSSRERDGVTVRVPSQSNACPLQIWEVYVATAILIVQPHSSIISAHVKALCEHNEAKHLCECVLKEHTSAGTVTDTSQDMSLYTFLEEYLNRKFQLTFARNSILKYITHNLDDPLCGRNGIPRVFLLGPMVQALLLNAQYWEGQYDELISGMRAVNLPVNDILQDGEQDIGDAVEITWDNVQLYDDPALILKKYGGWAVTKATRMLTPKDQLVMRLTGCTLEQLLKGVDVPDSPRAAEAEAAAGPEDQEAAQRSLERFKNRSKSKSKAHSTVGGRKKHQAAHALGLSAPQAAAKTLDELAVEEDSDSSHPSDYEVDPEHRKVVPLGVTLCEMYVLIRGLLVGMESAEKGSVVAEQVTRGKRDGHILAAAVLVDLYMREQIDVHHWTLSEGNIAVAYRVERRRGLGLMEHFLDKYVHHVETIFRDMRLPHNIAEGPIWANLEDRGVVDNYRHSWHRAYGCGFTRVDVWDLVRPDLVLDLKDGYLTAARVLYDKQFPDPLDEESNDILMFCYLLQQLFDDSLEAIDGMARVLRQMCPPFQKGELFSPVAMVHSGAVCLGLIDRAFRFANGQDVQLATEAAEFNEHVMERLEEQFFLSPAIWETMDADMSGELSMEEFVEGMRGVHVYKDFRKERVPDDVLRMIVSDLAERLFREVDVNMDGTLTQAELQGAFKRRREEALKQRAQKQWMRRGLRGAAKQMGIVTDKKPVDPARAEALAMRDEVRKRARAEDLKRRNDWQSEVDHLALPDAAVDIDTTVPAMDY